MPNALVITQPMGSIVATFEALKADYKLQSVSIHGASTYEVTLVLLPVPHEEQRLQVWSSVPTFAISLEATLDVAAEEGWRPDLISTMADVSDVFAAIVYSRTPVEIGRGRPDTATNPRQPPPIDLPPGRPGGGLGGGDFGFGDLDPSYSSRSGKNGRRVLFDVTPFELDVALGHAHAAGSVGYNLISLSAFHYTALEPTTRLCAVFDTQPKRRNQYSCKVWASAGPDADDNPKFQAMLEGWSRPVAVLPIPSALTFEDDDLTDEVTYDGFLGVVGTQASGMNQLSWWQNETFVDWPPWPLLPFTGGVRVTGPFAWSQFGAKIENLLERAGRWPLHVYVMTSGGTRYVTIVHTEAGRYKPKPRYLHRRGRGELKWGTGPAPLVALQAPSVVSDLTGEVADDFPEPLRDESVKLTYVQPEQAQHLQLWNLTRLPPGARPQRVRPPKPQWSAGPQQQSFQPPIVVAPKPPHILFADYLVPFMRKAGVRALEVAVARNHQLKLSLALTLAENGYPITEPIHKFRIASVAKLLTAMAAVRYMGPRAQVFSLGDKATSNLAIILGIPGGSPSFAGLSMLSADELLYRRSGWTYESPAGWAQMATVMGQMYGQTTLKAGDYQKFLSTWIEGAESVFSPNIPPYYVESYNNLNYDLMGEIIGAMTPYGFSGYSDGIRFDFWGLPFNSQLVDIELQNGWPAAQARGEAPCHLSVPGIRGGGPWVPWQYVVNYPAQLGSGGGYSLSMETLCWILSRMSPMALSPLLNPTEVRMLHELYELPHGYGDDPADYTVPPGRGCDPIEPLNGMPWNGGAEGPTMIIQHNGEGLGCNALAMHVIPRSGPVSPSLSLAIASNSNGAGGFGMSEMNDLYDLLRTVEGSQLWPAGDLWDEA